MNWKTFKIAAAISTLRISAMIMLVLTGGTMYTGVFLGMGGGMAVEDLLVRPGHGPLDHAGHIPCGGFFLRLPMLDWISVLLIFVPIFVPLITKAGL